MLELVRLLVQQLEDLHAGAEVELAGRLVGEQDRVAGRERARDRDALLLAAGQLVREVVQARRRARRARASRSRRRAASRSRPVDVDAELDVLERGQRGEEVERLEDEADAVAAEAEQLLARAPRDVLAGDDDPSLGRRVERADHVQQRRLAAARRARARR